MSLLLSIYHHAARELDAACGPGTARSEAIGMVITLGLFVILAIGLAAVTGDA
jgi:nitrate reductase NapE component